MMYEEFDKILNYEMMPALGCTDPIGIAYCAATARKHAKGEIQKIDAIFSGKLVKNAIAVVIPGSGGLCGVSIATALGVTCGDADKKLEVLQGITKAQVEDAVELEKSGKLNVSIADNGIALYMEIRLVTDQSNVTVVLQDGYTNIVKIVVNGDVILSADDDAGDDGYRYDLLNLDSIIDFAENAPLDNMKIIQDGLKMNEALAEAGLSRDFGANAGQRIRDRMAKNCADNLSYSAMMWSAAGVDARMSGCELPAMSNTGSGNQGIVCTMPVYGAAKALGSSWEETVRATALSCLISIYIKHRIGALSTVCGCVVAGTGSSCGIAYLQGGRKAELLDAIKNMFGNLAGMICDGAKASCALKTATCINAACMSADLALDGFGLESTNGIVGKGEEDTIDYFVRTSKQGLASMDEVIIDILLNK